MVRLNIVSGPDQGLVFELIDGQYQIGRDPDCQIPLSDGAVSRRHALLIVSGPVVQIQDLGSRHGTLVGGVPVQTASIGPTDTVQLGATAFTIESAADLAGAYSADTGMGWSSTPVSSGFNWKRNLAIFGVVGLLLMLGVCCMLGAAIKRLGSGGGIGSQIGGMVVSDRDFNKIDVGMSQEQVLKICGQPMMREPEGYSGGAEGGPEVWHYGNAQIDFREQKVVAKRKTTTSQPANG